jgi:hypothetical protein
MYVIEMLHMQVGDDIYVLWFPNTSYVSMK